MKKLIFVFTLALFVGCTQEPTLDLPGLSEETLEGGQWIAACFNRDGGPQIRKARYDGTNYVESAEVYSDLYCTQASFKMEEQGSYLVGEKLHSESSTRKLDRTISSIKMTPLTSTVADTFNGISFCGITNWSSGVAREVTGLTCDTLTIPQADTTYYDVYIIWPFSMSGPYSSITQGDLNFGYRDSEKDGTTEEKRPDSVTNPDFKRHAL